MTFPESVYTEGVVIVAPIDAVAAGLEVYLRENCDPVSFRRPYTPIRPIAVYRLIYNVDGTGYGPDLGEIRLRFLGENRTNLKVIPPSSPSESEIQHHVLGWSYWGNAQRRSPDEVQRALREKAVREHRLQQWPFPNPQWFENSKKIIEQERLETQRRVISVIFERFNKDGIQVELPVQKHSGRQRGGRPTLRESSSHEFLTRMAQVLWMRELREQKFEETGETLTWKQAASHVLPPASKYKESRTSLMSRISRDNKTLQRLIDDDDPIVKEIYQRKNELQEEMRTRKST